ncbi:Importin subunit beta-1 [Schizosaccharomyces pombe]|uniref:Importin subunit beta-1 n=1 Tax=Schizosaccharomyces pombe (strain 972 / ATCC 24843) TaxID=284812 RepID=IMB1_SCHPO|nr:karyopherin Kap95 [Schizosaccharomyces pombe]O13864.1 RecName: Full=Importin subunit beta-1; AltName: Full=Importin-95; AltName: Full=Karyopherin subunit beta-1; AltName: Full=Karyopherin-95 [Schizosaccharomyces pombe 972h-]CAB11082.1 karyopherin Kap95 [Schizosaccharomyces pombe]|eukprot:NP_594233.1 karyopherin Kap95 [Schizosaccharomyces pombe]
MNAGEFLAQTLSPDANVRLNAEKQLENAARTDFAQYMVLLAQELANDNSMPYIRMAAGLALKNAITAREEARKLEYQQLWQSLPVEIKQQVKSLALQTLGSSEHQAGQSAAQLVAAIAAYELATNQWPDLMVTLVANVGEGQPSALKQHSLQTIGYICESVSPEVLSAQSNAILTAVVAGARKEEPDAAVRLAALGALYDSLEFVRENFNNEYERNYIMQVVCEATQSPEASIQTAAFGCLVKIMHLYYDTMPFYMEKALFALTTQGMYNTNEQVALQAVEFWSTVCEEEIEVNLEIQEAQDLNEVPARQNHGFARAAAADILPVLLKLLCNQDEDADEDDWNISMAAATCLQLFAQVVGDLIVNPVLAFVEQNIQNPDWHQREAAVMAFGSVLEGPNVAMLTPLVNQALPVLINMMVDPVIFVKDTTAWALGQISSFVADAINPEIHLSPMVSALLQGLTDNPRIVANCCWAFMNLVCHFAPVDNHQTSVMTPFYEAIIGSLLHVTDQKGNENNSRTSGYETLGTLITFSSDSVLPMIANVLSIILTRLETSIQMQSQILDVEDRANHDELQSNLCNVLTSIIRRFGPDIRTSSDQIMNLLLQTMQTAPKQSVVHEDVLLAIGAMMNSLEEQFEVYVPSFVPFLSSALSNEQEYQLCSVAVGLVGDLARALNAKILPYCDDFMTRLVQDLQSSVLDRNVKPAILSCFSDIALAIGAAFQTYLEAVMVLLQQASSVQAPPGANFSMIDYVDALRLGIVEAYVGITQAVRTDNRLDLIQPYVHSMFTLLNMITADPECSESLTRAALGLLGDLAESFPKGELKSYFAADWVAALLNSGKTKISSQQTKDLARWATEQVKRQARA